MKQSNLKRTTPKAEPKDFISGAGTEASSKPTYPWGTAYPHKTKVYNLRLPEPAFEKLKYISENVPFMSMQRFCQEVLNPAIDKKIKELTG